MEAFSEELRELNIYTSFSPFYLEGEITAKLVIPTAQIERADFWDLSAAKAAIKAGSLPAPTKTLSNGYYVKPEKYNNLRELLA